MIRSLPRLILGRTPRWIELACFGLILSVRASGIPTITETLERLEAPHLARELARESSLRLDSIPLLHSHNDYEQPRPLEDALANGMDSVEADLWLGSNGQLEVSHTGLFVRGTLEDLYLKPLLERVDANRLSASPSAPFILWLDLKEDRPELIVALEQTLARYQRMLTRFRPLPDGGVEHAGHVVVILTGSPVNKCRYSESPGSRLASRDSSGISADDPLGVPAWEWNTVRWSSQFRWTGVGRMPAEDRDALRTLVDLTHARGRKLRIYGAPESEAYWREAARLGVDMIGADSIARLGKLGRAWREHSDSAPQTSAAELPGRGGSIR